MFKEERVESTFNWNMIGDIDKGRPNLGNSVDVSLYRLMQFTLRDVLIKKFDTKTADQVFFEAGEVAGTAFCENLVSKDSGFPAFISQVRDLFSELKIGILRVEKSDFEKMRFTLTIAEDLDCSGLPLSGETICTYDEGFIAGMLSEYTGKKFKVKEVDCWCSGERVCRFNVKPSVEIQLQS